MNFNQEQEWNFITTEIHQEKPNKKNLIVREILFGLQILLRKLEIENYLALKNIYCTEKFEPGHKTSGSC